MPAAVKIRAGKYGSAIGLLLERGGAFQTRPERTLIVNSEQRRALEEANLVEPNGLTPILKTAGHIEQQEILVLRTECRFDVSRALPRGASR